MHLMGRIEITGIKKKTNAVFFKDLNVGAEFDLVYRINGHYHSAPYIDIYIGNERVHGNNASQLLSNLDKFEYKQIG